jgi:hypothetical protein
VEVSGVMKRSVTDVLLPIPTGKDSAYNNRDWNNGTLQRYVDGPNSAGEFSAGVKHGTSTAQRGGFKSEDEARAWLKIMERKVRAKDSVGNVAQWAAIVALLIKVFGGSDGETVGPESYDLAAYRPPKRKW